MSHDTSAEALVQAAESEWLGGWALGPTEEEGTGLPPGAPAPDLALPDETGTPRQLSEFWADGPALLMFWRHFGCSCGVARAGRLLEQWEVLRAAGLTPVVVSQGEPARAAAYRAEHHLPCSVLCDPDHTAYRQFGVGHWPVERILHDAPEAFWRLPLNLGVALQAERRAQGRPLVDDPWRQAMDVVVGTDGLVRLTFASQYCEDHPPASVLAAAGRLS
ncbi:MAG TPA: redoxin domain-containing protein [Ornithinibacter sp.]|nr:redoxin domain-containing protein [Ornithinibacter sp.]